MTREGRAVSSSVDPAAVPFIVVCGRLEGERILIITAYEPDPKEWESDWHTRRR